MALQHQGKKKRPPTQKRKAKTLAIGIAAAGGICLILILFWLIDPREPGLQSSPSEKNQRAAGAVGSSVTRDLGHLAGRWIRTDGGYVIDIKKVHEDGELEAGYFNPRPIHVSRAEVTLQSNGPEVFIELQDKGYPGSTYTLTFDPIKNTLTGYYYQATMQQEFDVQFVRLQPQTPSAGTH